MGFFSKKEETYNPFLSTQKVLSDLRERTKKGSTYTNAIGQVTPHSDFARGVAMGRYQLLCEQAKYYNEKLKKQQEKENKSQKNSVVQEFERL